MMVLLLDVLGVLLRLLGLLVGLRILCLLVRRLILWDSPRGGVGGTSSSSQGPDSSLEKTSLRFSDGLHSVKKNITFS